MNNQKFTNSFDRELQEEDRNKFDFDGQGLERMDSHITLNVEAMDMNSDHDENLDDPDLYFGEVAVDKFWDFYKSDRKFKDFTATKDSMLDPR